MRRSPTEEVPSYAVAGGQMNQRNYPLDPGHFQSFVHMMIQRSYTHGYKEGIKELWGTFLTPDKKERSDHSMADNPQFKSEIDHVKYKLDVLTAQELSTKEHVRAEIATSKVEILEKIGASKESILEEIRKTNEKIDPINNDLRELKGEIKAFKWIVPIVVGVLASVVVRLIG